MIRVDRFFLLYLCLVVALASCAGDKDARKKEASRATAKQNLGLQLIQTGDLQRGLQELLEAAELNPDDVELQHSIASAYRRLGEPDKSVYHFKQALRLKPDSPDIRNSLGAVYFEMEEWDLAIEQLTMAAEDPMYDTRHMAYNNLGAVYQQKGNYREAIQYYEKSVRLSPKNSPAFDHMGLAYESVGEWEPAIESYKRSIEYSPDFPISYLHLGKLYLKLGRHEEAGENLNQAIKTDSKGPFAREARKLLEQMNKSQ